MFVGLICSASVLEAGRVRIEQYWFGTFSTSQTGDVLSPEFNSFWQKQIAKDVGDESKTINWRQETFDDGYSVTISVFNK